MKGATGVETGRGDAARGASRAGDGTTGQAEVVALFKLTREGKVFQCNELTKVMHGPADLGSIMDVTAA